MATVSSDAQTSRSEIDEDAIASHVREILILLGEDPNRDGLVDTPGRVARSFIEQTQGLHLEPKRHLRKTFDSEAGDQVLQGGTAVVNQVLQGGTVVVKDIPFVSLCEHHLLPFTGKAHVAYLPTGRVVGLSKIARLIDDYAARPQVQERLTAQVALAMNSIFGVFDCMVVIEASHQCMDVRGVKKHGSKTVTEQSTGTFSKQRKAEILSLFQY